jgi:hypothetical protein
MMKPRRATAARNEHRTKFGKPGYRQILRWSVLGMIVAGAVNFVDKFDTICAAADARLGTNLCGYPAPDLVVSSFASESGPAPGNEHVLRSAPPRFEDSIAFQSGARLTLTVRRPVASRDAVTISSIALKSVYSDTRNSKLDYDYSASNFVGKGLVDALSYRVRLEGTKLQVFQIAGGAQVPTEVDANDILGSKQVELRSKDEVQTLKLDLVPRRNGLYALTLSFVWSANGNTRETRSQTVYLYRNEN